MSGHTDNTVVINAPLDLVWDMTNDIQSWPELFSEYAKAEILGTESGTVRFRLTMHPDEQGREWSWVSERTPDKPSRSVRARRVEPGPLLERMDITWEYQPVDDGVAMRWVQDFDLAPTAPVNDAQAVAHLNAQTQAEMTRIKKLVEAAAAGSDSPSGAAG